MTTQHHTMQEAHDDTAPHHAGGTRRDSTTPCRRHMTRQHHTMQEAHDDTAPHHAGGT